jgi:predicted dienelactone hydrolase
VAIAWSAAAARLAAVNPLVAIVSITATNLTWHDEARDRDVPVRVYAPATVTNPVPLIVFSHGLGGTREGYRYLGEHWARHGFIAVHVQHPGSDISIFNGPGTPRAKALRAVANLEHSHNRPQDISFVLDQLAADPRINPNAIGVAGHSFGAHTALAILGMTIEGRSHLDKRVKAAVAMSSPRPAKPAALAGIQAPCLHLTGTADDSPIFPELAIDRAYCYHHIVAPDQYLVVLKGAHHFTFSDNPVWAGKRVERDPAHQPRVAELSAQFFAAHLTGNPAAKQWLAENTEHK